MIQNSTRAGILQKQVTGYSAFIPALLSPIPEISLDRVLLELSSEASFKLGRLDGIGRRLPNPELFLSIFVRQEALLSSQIEGTQCTLEEVLNFSVEPQKENEEVKEVINYVEAMQLGLAKLQELPLSRRLLCEIHRVLLNGARGANKTPGQVRKSQNWIGGSSPASAHFVPPPVEVMEDALVDLEKFLHVKTGINPLIQIAIAHAQFETIHPFQDGNGRLGRLLITLFLCERQLLTQPLLYLSHFLKGNQFEYFKRLDAIREDGDWEGWIKFFLEGVIKVSDQAIKNAEGLIALSTTHHQALVDSNASSWSFKLIDYLLKQPTVTIGMVEKELGCTYTTAKSAISELEQLALLKETTGFKRNKRYEYEPYLAFWREAQDDFSSTNPATISHEKLTKAIESLRQNQPSASLSLSIGSGQWTVQVDDVEVCKIDQWVYEKLMMPMRDYQREPEEIKRKLEIQFLKDLANVLERIQKYGPEPEFDSEETYHIHAVGRTALAKVIDNGELLRFEFLGGEAPEMMGDAVKFPIPWEFEFISDDGKHKQKKVAQVVQCGMDKGILWMTVSRAELAGKNRQPNNTELLELATHYLVIDGTAGAIQLRPLTFYYHIFEKAYTVPGLQPWRPTQNLVQSMKEALERLNSLGRFEIFAYPGERDKYVEAVPGELKEKAKKMAGLIP